MVAIDPDRCRQVLAEIERLAILELEEAARRMMESDVSWSPRPPSQNRDS